MKEPMFNIIVISGPKPVSGVKPYVQMTLGVHATPETPGSPMSQAKMRRLEATLVSFGPSDMFAVNRHLWVRWNTEDGEVRFHCRYYKDGPWKVEETEGQVMKTMSEFIEGLRLEKDPMSHVGWPADRFESRYYLPYLLGVTDDCPVT